MKKILFGLFVFVSVLGFSHNVFALTDGSEIKGSIEINSDGSFTLFGLINADAIDRTSGFFGVTYGEYYVGQVDNRDFSWPDYSGINLFEHNLGCTVLSDTSVHCPVTTMWNPDAWGLVSGQAHTYGVGNYWIGLKSFDHTNNILYYFPFYFDGTNFSGGIIESCSDGIQNQNETGIDIGGVCGSNSIVFNDDQDTTNGGGILHDVTFVADGNYGVCSYLNDSLNGAAGVTLNAEIGIVDVIAGEAGRNGEYIKDGAWSLYKSASPTTSCATEDHILLGNFEILNGLFPETTTDSISNSCVITVNTSHNGNYGFLIGNTDSEIFDSNNSLIAIGNRDSELGWTIDIDDYWPNWATATTIYWNYWTDPSATTFASHNGVFYRNGVNDCSSIPPIVESCSDGIQNQDETGIDTGGVCSTSIYTGPTGIVFSDFNYVGFNPVGQRDILVSCANHVGDINSLYNNTTLGTAHTCTGGSFWLQYNMPLFGTSNLDPIPDGNYCIDFNGGDFIPCTDGEFIVANGVFSTELPPASCFDGIQNQDETGIDNGGVCIFYTKIKNTNNGLIELMNEVSLDADDINKTLPEDWIVQVTNVRDPSGNPVSYGGYYWYEVTDPTDGVSGWMKGSNDTETTFYLPYDIDNQDEYEDIAVDQYSTMATRATRILEAINHYYNDSNTAGSLYSSDDNDNNKISLLKNSGFPEKLIWGMAVSESGDYSFNNEIVSPDYGHGIMQLTFNALYYEKKYNTSKADYDNRGIGSKISIPDCASKGSSNYVDCYKYAGTGNGLAKPYKNYQDNPNNPIYKYYTNTWQSIYANIKDALHVLSSAYNRYNYIVSEHEINSVLYSADDIRNILTVRRYNGSSDEGCRYVNKVATNLDKIGNYFTSQSASDISPLISKMYSAGSQVKCADLYSPGELSIQDSKGRTVGVVNGQGVNDFPIADYDIEEKNVVILAAEDDNYKYNVVGTEEGTYDLDITIIDGEETITFEARDIVILPGQVHSYSVDEEALLKGKNGVTVSIDRNGDGKIDRIIKTGKKLSGHNYNLKATQKELKAFAKRNSKLIKKIISHKIKKLKTLKNYKHNN